jgi:hypothetical protein
MIIATQIRSTTNLDFLTYEIHHRLTRSSAYALTEPLLRPGLQTIIQRLKKTYSCPDHLGYLADVHYQRIQLMEVSLLYQYVKRGSY